jgi:hypothetical protein
LSENLEGSSNHLENLNTDERINKMDLKEIGRGMD